MAQRKRPGSDMNFESSLQKLEAIVKRLEEEEIPLETSLTLFAEGQSLARACEEQLRAAENQIRQLLEKPSGKIEEVEFDSAAISAPAEAEAGEEEEAAESGEEETEEAGAKEATPAKPAVKSEQREKRNLDELPF